MPPLAPVPNVLKAQLHWSLAGAPDMQTVLHFRYAGGPPTPTDALALATDIYNAMAPVATYWSSDINLSECVVTDLSSATASVGTHSGSTPGLRTPGGLDNGTALVVNYHIDRRYRGGKPRSYFPFGVGSDMTTRRSWDSAFVTAVQGALNTFFATCIGSTSGTTSITQQVSVSYFSGFTVVTDPTTGRAKNVPVRRATPLVDPITGITASLKPGSQRRRN